MYSTSYLHQGAPKTWYGVSAASAASFESAFAEAFPNSLSKDPHLLAKKAAMLPPWMLTAAGIPVCRAVQRPSPPHLPLL